MSASHWSPVRAVVFRREVWVGGQPGGDVSVHLVGAVGVLGWLQETAHRGSESHDDGIVEGANGQGGSPSICGW
jgi:hypothetical protein